MIHNRQELHQYLDADKVRNLGEHVNVIMRIIQMLLSTEGYCMYRYLRNLRFYEYYRYQFESSNGLRKCMFVCPYFLRKIRYYRLCHKYGVCIVPNVVGPGLRIPHFAGGVIINCASMGANCIASSGVVIGNKGAKDNVAVIGDNVELTLGAKIIGGVHIGNNVIVAPNSVVVKDVPDNCVVSGVPATILKTRS